MKSKYYKIPAAILVASAIIIFIFYSSPSSAVSASTPAEIITSTLERIGVEDAVNMGIFSQEDVENSNYILYSSNSTGFFYRFDPITGQLKSIRKNPDVQIAAIDSTPQSDTLTDDERRSSVLSHVSNCMQNMLIGELEISRENFSNTNYSYLILEYYDGVETGSSAFVSCTPEGIITVSSFKYGTVFCRKADGTIALSKDTPFINEETAIANALDFIEDHASERGCTVQSETAACALKASEDLQYFEVSVDTYEDDGYVVTYDVWVDVHSGEIQSFQFTQ